VAHQLYVEGQLLEAEVLEDGQDKFPTFCREEEIAIVDAGRNALEREGAA